MKTGLEGAQVRIQALVHWQPVAAWLQKRAAAAPAMARQCMGLAVAWWYAQALPRIPVRASLRPGQFRRQGRGMLKKSTRPYVLGGAGSDGVSGGIIAGQHYAIWLAAGTRKIARGRVMRWKPGQATITTWPAKTAGGNPRGELPILLPWHGQARKKLITLLKERL